MVTNIESDVVEEVGAGELHREVIYTNQSLKGLKRIKGSKRSKSKEVDTVMRQPLSLLIYTL